MVSFVFLAIFLAKVSGLFNAWIVNEYSRELRPATERYGELTDGIESMRLIRNITILGAGVSVVFFIESNEDGSSDFALRSVSCRGLVFPANVRVAINMPSDEAEPLLQLANSDNSLIQRWVYHKCVSQETRVSRSLSMKRGQAGFDLASSIDVSRMAYGRFFDYKDAPTYSSEFTLGSCNVTSSAGFSAYVYANESQPNQFHANLVCRKHSYSLGVNIVYVLDPNGPSWCKQMGSAHNALAVDELCMSFMDRQETITFTNGVCNVTAPVLSSSTAFYTVDIVSGTSGVKCPDGSFKTNSDDRAVARVTDCFLSRRSEFETKYAKIWRATTLSHQMFYNHNMRTATFLDHVGICYGLASWEFSGLNLRRLCVKEL